MHPLPHRYSVTSKASPGVPVLLRSPGLSDLSSQPPVEFSGPGDLWSPETLLMAAVADCFTLTFRAAAQITRLTWTELEVEARGVVDRVEGLTQFTEIHLRVVLQLPDSQDTGRALKLIEKAEKGCLVANSLKSKRTMESIVEAAGSDASKIA